MTPEDFARFKEQVEVARAAIDDIALLLNLEEIGQPRQSMKQTPTPLGVAKTYIGRDEEVDRISLTEFLSVDPVDTPWCGYFISSCLRAAGYPITPNPGVARGYADYGDPTDDPAVGDLAVWRSHVAFVAELDQIKVLGGNQSNEVNISPKIWFDKYSKFLGYRKLPERDATTSI